MIINFKNMSGNGGNTGIGEAPIDGKQYARQDATWTEVQAKKTITFRIPQPDWETGNLDPSSLTGEEQSINAASVMELHNSDDEGVEVVVKDPYGNRFEIIDQTINYDFSTGEMTEIVELWFKQFDRPSNAYIKWNDLYIMNDGSINTAYLKIDKDKDAPADGKPYARRDGLWVQTLTDAPADDQAYARANNEWYNINYFIPSNYRLRYTKDFTELGFQYNTAGELIKTDTFVNSYATERQMENAILIESIINTYSDYDSGMSTIIDYELNIIPFIMVQANETGRYERVRQRTVKVPVTWNIIYSLEGNITRADSMRFTYSLPKDYGTDHQGPLETYTAVLARDGSVREDWTLVPSAGVSKQYVDDLVGAANNKLETI